MTLTFFVVAAVFFLLGAALAGPLGLWVYIHQRPCPHCRKRISRHAVTCSECGKELEPRRRVSKKSSAPV
jgi:predicted amidophosphoribosyltransferase